LRRFKDFGSVTGHAKATKFAPCAGHQCPLSGAKQKTSARIELFRF
jgi:hypothetical protein